MVRLALEGETLEKRRQAVRNCVVLTREASDARKLLEQQAPMRLLPLLRDADSDIRIHTFHVYSGLVEQGGALPVLASLRQANIFDELLAKVWRRKKPLAISCAYFRALFFRFLSATHIDFRQEEEKELLAGMRTYMVLLEALSDSEPAEGSPQAGALDLVLEQLIAAVRKRGSVFFRFERPSNKNVLKSLNLGTSTPPFFFLPRP